MVLLTESFPPSLGGSSALFGEIYRRLPLTGSVVAAGDDGPAREIWGSLAVARTLTRMAGWGVGNWRGYLSMRRALLAAGGRQTIVHCGRALPEGLAAAIRSPAGGPFLCWVHGEELGYCAQSRELRWLMRRVHQRAAAFLANSHNSRRLLEELGIPRTKIHVVHPGVELARPDPARVEHLRRRLAGPGQRLLLSVGRLERRKGHDLVLDALPILRRRHDVRYAVVGDGVERARLEALAAEGNVQDIVSFESAVAHGDLPAYFAACDLFVMPNRAIGGDVEGFGIVFLEAAAAGKATVGGNSGGVPEAIEAGTTGLLVSGTDVGELVDAIDRLLSDPARREQMGHAGRVRVVKDFTWDAAASKVLEVHRAVAGAFSG